MQVATKDKTQIFFDDNLDVINFWVSQINIASKFYVWLQAMIKIRYKIRGAGASNEVESSTDCADSLISTVIGL